MTLNDYFEKAVQNSGRMHRRCFQEPAQPLGKNRFHRILKGMTAGPEPGHQKPGGLTLTDYRANPVPVKYDISLVKKQQVQEVIGARTATAVDDKGLIHNQSSPVISVSNDIAQNTNHAIESGHTEKPVMFPCKKSERQFIDDCVKSAASKFGLPEKLIHLVIQAESGYRPHVVSGAGAQGLMQLMPETAKDLGVSDPFDIRQNIEGGVRYLGKMMDRFEGDVRLALAAYNAGPGNVEKYQGIPPFKETRQYVQKIMKKFEETV